MSYIDGYVIPVPSENKEKYIELAQISAAVFKDHGAIEVVENWGDDVPEGTLTSFYKSVQSKEDESIVFSWVIWPSKEARDEGWTKVMNDSRMDPKNNPTPFDGKRLIYGGFENIIRA